MKVYIFVGGSVVQNAIALPPSDDDICIAADSGFDNAVSLGYENRINKLVGDLDSIKQKNIPDSIEIVQVPAEKDVTDTQLAVSLALEYAPEEIRIIGGLSGRLDHTLANLSILEYLKKAGVYATICDGKNRARFIKNSSLILCKSEYKYFSLLCVSETAKGVSIEGAKYPLKKATVTREHQFAVSNEIKGNCALVTVKKGSLYIIESN